MKLQRIAVLCALAPGLSWGASWQSAAPSTLTFEGAAQGESFTGAFKQFSARIEFDADNLATTRFEVDIDLGSADSQNAERDELLREEAFFDVGNQPTARFIAVGAEPDGEGYLARGTLNLKGHSRAVNFRFRLSPDGDGAQLVGEAVLDRTDFGVGSGDWEDAETIEHRVTVRTTLTLAPTPTAP
jgi:polyisoprenoid-binding protein YceI